MTQQPDLKPEDQEEILQTLARWMHEELLLSVYPISAFCELPHCYNKPAYLIGHNQDWVIRKFICFRCFEMSKELQQCYPLIPPIVQVGE